ncbi:MAG: 3'-5' exonuclease [Alphaproteobacteria bacterium]|nr:3'-5' exonuclease [Alphaproteobacteria bacterium]MBR6684641.1 3'-5' exonuclease [Alphaproteobacteria bacterium]
MTINDVLFFDTETTGIPDRAAKWDVDFMQYPHVVQMAWIHGCKVENHIIRPDGWTIPDETVEIHGITNEYAMEHGEPFAAVVDMFISDCHDAGLICGHNIHFDTGIVKANILRELGREYYDANDVETALYKGKRIDTMRSTMKWVDARNSWGKLKFPNLGELYARCFPGETFPAHDALEDTKAVARCLPVLVDMGLLELKVKEYAEQATDPGTTVVRIAEIASDAAKIAADAAKKFGSARETAGNGPILDAKQKDDKLPIQPAKAPEIENFTKISDAAAELLDQNDF